MWDMPRIKMHSREKLFQHSDLKGWVSLPANVANMSPSHLPLELHLNENPCTTLFPKLPLTFEDIWVQHNCTQSNNATIFII